MNYNRVIYPPEIKPRSNSGVYGYGSRQIDIDKVFESCLKFNHWWIILENCAITDDQFIKLMTLLFKHKNNVNQIWVHVGNCLTDKTTAFLNTNSQYLIAYYLWIYGNNYNEHIDASKIHQTTFIAHKDPRINGNIDGQYNLPIRDYNISQRIYMITNNDLDYLLKTPRPSWAAELLKYKQNERDIDVKRYFSFVKRSDN